MPQARDDRQQAQPQLANSSSSASCRPSPAGLVDMGELLTIGGVYDLATGKVELV
jgi:hypothetical protein